MSTSPDYRKIRVTPLSGALGAEIHGVDASSSLDDDVVGELRRALVEYLVVFLRDQRLSLEQLKVFSARFGPLSRIPYVEPLAEHPEIIAVLKEADERDISTFGGTWHSDYSFLPEPPMMSILYAEEVPECGGDTLWVNMYAAHETLSPGLRALLDPMKAMHSGHVYGAARPPTHLRTSTSIAISRGDPDADAERAHPVVRLHPESEKQALFVNPVYTTRFEHMTEAESAPLLEFLYTHCTRPELSCRFRWRPGSMALWDNRCTLHMAINDYDGARRLMYRTSIAGEAHLATSH
jgi:taurine dioxygenase